jgi:hypothetical protein
LDASKITVNGSNHSETFFLSLGSFSADVIDNIQIISGFFAVNLITLVASSIPLLLSLVKILNS